MVDFSEDFAELDDSALLSMRAEMRAELERLPPASPEHAALTALYDETTEEVDDRARRAWAKTSLGAPAMCEPVTVEAAISHLPARAARMVAIEVLLADPAALGDDTLESGLYILRERLRAAE
jgi:hypothetical protein